MKKVLIYILLIGQFCLLAAEEISKELAMIAAQDLLMRSSIFIKNNDNNDYYVFGDSFEITEDNTSKLVAYVFNLKPVGFVIVSADNRIEPIIAYSNNSNFITSETSDNTLLFLIKKDIKLWKKGINESRVNTEEFQKKWENITKLSKEGKNNVIRKVEVVYGPHLYSKWGQGTVWNSAIGEYERVYNIYTPNNWAIGCNATAMVQILNYYEWPISGTGSRSYSENGRFHSVEFSATSYDWSNTLDIYKGVVTTQEQKNNASLISYHSAVSLDMDFSSTGSTSSITDAPYALANYFRFTGHYKTVSGYSNFYTRLRENMENGRPSHLAISSGSPIGHAIVCDGYDSSTNFYHLNMGWSGSNDAWYNITGSFNAGGYTTIDGAVLDMIPEPDILSISASESNPLTVTVSWSTSEKLNADLYQLQQKFGSSGSWTTISNSISTENHTFTVPSEGTYYYRVRAHVDGYWYNNSYSAVKIFSTISNNDFRTKQSGDWTSNSTWEVYNNGWQVATSYPTYLDGVITIQNSHTIRVNSDVTVNEVIIETGGQITVLNGQDLSINNGAGTDIKVHGALRKEGSSRILYVGSGTTTAKFYDGSTFQLAGTNKYIPVADWDKNSTIEITGTFGGNMTSTYHTNQEFGNFVWNTSSQTSNVYFSGNLTRIRGDFHLINTNGYELRLTGTAGSDPTITIGGNVNISGGILNLTSGANNIYFVCRGSYMQTNGEIKATGSGIGYLRFGATSGGGYSGTFLHSGGVFSPENIQVNKSFALTLNSDIDISSSPFIINGVLNVQDHIVNGSGTFTLNSISRLITGNSSGINGSINTSVINLNVGADYEFNGAVSQVTGTLLPNSLTDGLIINNSNGVTLTQSTTVSGGKTGLVLTNGVLTTSNDKIVVLDTDGYWSGGNDNSFVNGPITRTFNSTSTVTKTFPTGKADKYRRLALTISHDSATPTQYKCEVFNSAPTNRNIPSSIYDVAENRYWKVIKGSGANVISAKINLFYAEDDSVIYPEHLRIVKSDGAGNWVDLGGTGSNSISGNITSTVNFSDFGDFALANSINIVSDQLASFTAKKMEDGVLLNWESTTKVDNYRFEVMRKISNKYSDGLTDDEWKPLGFVGGKENDNSTMSYSIYDKLDQSGTISYRLKQIDKNGSYIYSEAIEVSFMVPSKFDLSNNYPNPFNPTTTFKFSIPNKEFVTLAIYNALGEKVADVVSKDMQAGNYEFNWNAKYLTSGVYFARLTAGEKMQVRKVMLLK